jgi:predicted Zn-dependent peptidase
MEAQIMLGFEGRPITRDDFYTAQILAAILGGGMSSRLFQEVREKRGLCYSVYAFHWGFADTGIFGVHAATGPDDVAELMPVDHRRAGAGGARHRPSRRSSGRGRSCAPAC